MKLIDADNYCESICKCIKDKCDKNKCPIMTAPVAYDVNKVIKNIESEIELVVTDYYLQGKYIKKSQAINIVKAGGKNEQSITDFI